MAAFNQNDFWVVANVDFVIDPVTLLYMCTVTSVDQVNNSSWAGTNL